ncbi:MAG: hypothetical protein IJX62_06785, partial [Clostridia bacterium]|nr:hypothetical protein [Clostridia bacterium]
WGSNSFGQLGNASQEAMSATPVAVRIGTSESDLLQLGQGPAVITQNAHISVQANIPAPTYTVSIPSTIPVGSLEQTVAKQDQSHLSNTSFRVTVSNVDHLFNEKKVVVSITSDDSTGNFVLRDRDNNVYLLPYAVFTAYGNEHEIDSGEVFAEFTDNGEISGYVQIDRSQISRDGSYSGTMIFSIAVEALTAEN